MLRVLTGVLIAIVDIPHRQKILSGKNLLHCLGERQFGEIGEGMTSSLHPSQYTLAVSNISHIALNFRIENVHELRCDIGVLNTQDGLLLDSLLRIQDIGFGIRYHATLTETDRDYVKMVDVSRIVSINAILK